MYDNRTDFELLAVRSQAMAEMKRHPSRSRQAYWQYQYRKADDVLRDRNWARLMEQLRGEE